MTTNEATNTSPATPTSSATPALPDLREPLLHAFERAGALVRVAVTDDLEQPTPCTDMDLRDLLGHLLTVVTRIRVVLTGGHFAEVEQITRVPDEEVLPTWDAALAALRSDLPGVDLAAPCTFPFGTVPAAVGIVMYVNEVTVHSWDLARTVDRDDLLDPSLADLALPVAQERIPREGREQFPFGEVVDVPDDAPAYDRLVAWMGRDPSWSR